MNKYVIFLSLAILASFGSCSEKPRIGFGFAEYKEMMNGFLLGITIPEKFMDKLLGCLTDQKHLEVKFVETMDKIDKLDFTNLPLTAELFVDLYDGLIMSIVEIDLCAEENSEYDILFQRIYHLMPSTIMKRLMLNFISNPQQIFKDIQDAVDSYHNGKFKQVGRDLGDIMHMVLLYKMDGPTMNLEDYVAVIKGLLKGLNINRDIEKVLKCVEVVPDAVTAIIQAIEALRNIDIHHIKEIVDSIMKIFNGLKHALNELAVCAETVPELKDLVDKLSKITVERIIDRVNSNLLHIILDIMSARAAWESKEYERFGQSLGAILYRIILDPKATTA